jgi:hypothetical protein
MRRAGELLRLAAEREERQKQGRPKKTFDNGTILSDLGADRKDSHRFPEVLAMRKAGEQVKKVERKTKWNGSNDQADHLTPLQRIIGKYSWPRVQRWQLVSRIPAEEREKGRPGCPSRPRASFLLPAGS